MKKKVIKREKSILQIQPPKRVAAYARVSSGKEQMLHSLAAQVSYYSDYIQSHPGWVYAGVYADEALTGTKDNRPEFRRLLEDCRSGRINLVLTKSISRFARNTVHLLETARELKLLGVDVFFEEQNIHTMSGDGELLLTILASYAQEESRSVSENCKWRIRKQFENGELANLRFMYGYDIVKGGVRIVPEQAAIVRMIFDDYLSGLGCRRIVKKLKAMGVAKPRGGQWTSARVMGIIKNEKYAGDALLQKKYVKDHLTKQLVYNRGELAMYFAEGTHPAIIEKATFESAQALLRKRHAEFNVKCKPRSRYPFTGIIQCANCGKTYKRRVNAGGAAWQCSTYLQKGKSACHAKRIPESALYALSAEVTGISAFDEAKFKDSIKQILVPKPNKLVFVFRDGRTVEKAWRDRSRSESWTDEMRKAASENAKRRRKQSGDKSKHNSANRSAGL